MSNFAALKKKTKANFNTVQKKLEEEATGNNFTDDRFWTYKADEKGSAQVTLRFLPLWEGGDETTQTPVVKVISHGILGKTGKWYIEECPSALNGGKIVPGECPVCDDNKAYTESMGGWKAMTDQQRKKLRASGDTGQGRRTQYIANIYIVNDAAQPENNGTVKLWKFGPKIKGMIDSAINPEFDDQESLDPYDLWEGANFKLRVRKVDDQTNYDKSSFDKPSALSADDAELEKIWLQEHNLFEFIDPNNKKLYKSLADMQKRWNLMKDIKAPKAESAPEAEADESPESTAPEEASSQTESVAPNPEDEDDAFFDDLLNE